MRRTTLFLGVLLFVGLASAGCGQQPATPTPEQPAPAVTSETPSVTTTETAPASETAPAANTAPTTATKTTPAPTSAPAVAPVAAPTTTSFTMADVAAHKDATSCYTVINSTVYDVTSWISKHPGGERAILGTCGKDATDAFTNKHGGQEKPESILATFKIGTLAQ